VKLEAFNAAHGYGAVKSALRAPSPLAAPGAEKPLAGAAFDAAHALASAVKRGEDASLAMMTTGADPHSVVEAMAAAELAVETAVTVRDKIVEAYQELLRMPV
jgi:flagellar hook-basal body complex protein FliE